MAKVSDKERAIARDKFRAMTCREKAVYIWEYYKVYFVLAVVALVVAGVYIGGVYQDMKEEKYVHIGVLEIYAADTMYFMDQVAQTENWGEPLAYRVFASAMDASMEGIYQAAGFLANDEMDIIICDADNLAFFLDSGISAETDRVIALLDTELEKNLGGKDLCMIVLNGEERSQKAQEFAELLLKYT